MRNVLAAVFVAGSLAAAHSAAIADEKPVYQFRGIYSDPAAPARVPPSAAVPSRPIPEIPAAETPIQQLRRHFAEMYPHARIEATPVGDSVVLRGSVGNSTHIKQMTEIAEQLFPTVLNYLESGQMSPKDAASPGPMQKSDTKTRTYDRLREIPAAVKDETGWRVYDAETGTLINLPRHLKSPMLLKPAKPAPPARADSEDMGATSDLRRDVASLRQEVQRLSKLLERPLTAPSEVPLKSDADRRTLRSLESTLLTIEPSDSPLQDLCRKIAKACNVNVVLDVRGLQEEGLTTETRVRADGNTLTGATLLKVVLEPHGLSYIVEDGVLKVTSRQRAQGKLTVVTYAVADLAVPVPNVIEPAVAENPGEKATDPVSSVNSHDLDSLSRVLMTAIEPASWDEVGGPGSVRKHEGTLSLVVRQTANVHEQIANLLSELRKLQDVQTYLKSHILTMPAAIAKKELGVSEGQNAPIVQIDGERAARLIELCRESDDCVQATLPRATLFNGQSAVISTSSHRDGSKPDHRIALRSVVASDRRSVKLSLQDRSSRSADKIEWRTLGTIPDGRWVLVDITPLPPKDAPSPTNAVDRELPRKESSEISANRTYLLISPAIVVSTEEEEPLAPSRLR